MTKEQYLFLLRAELTGRLPDGELEDILRYYTEYFEEAGPEREREVMTGLGSPERLAQKILGEEPEEFLTPVEAVYEPVPDQGRVMPKWLFVLLAAAVAIVAVPAWAGVVLGLGAGGIGCMLAGVGVGIGSLFWGGWATRFYLAGGGMMAFGVGLAMLLATIWLVRWSVRGVKYLWRKLTEGEARG